MAEIATDRWFDGDLPGDLNAIVDRVATLLDAIDRKLAAGEMERDPEMPASLQAAGRFFASALPSLRFYLLACDDCLETAGDAAVVGAIGMCDSQRCLDIEAAGDLKNLLLYGPGAFVDYARQLEIALARTQRVVAWLRKQLEANQPLRWNLQHAGSPTGVPMRTQRMLDELHYKLARESLGLEGSGFQPTAPGGAKTRPAQVHAL